ncbi:MAG: hypothetical protein LBB79_05215, partial [Prevotellaceae bacterium]|nr:hypothetical protein [Prevotellaceae bacterium]
SCRLRRLKPAVNQVSSLRDLLGVSQFKIQNSKFSTAIPLGMERSVENHPHHRTRHSVGMSPKYLWAHSYRNVLRRKP